MLMPSSTSSPLKSTLYERFIRSFLCFVYLGFLLLSVRSFVRLCVRVSVSVFAVNANIASVFVLLFSSLVAVALDSCLFFSNACLFVHCVTLRFVACYYVLLDCGDRLF